MNTKDSRAVDMRALPPTLADAVRELEKRFIVEVMLDDSGNALAIRTTGYRDE